MSQPTDFTDLLDNADLPEVVKVLVAWRARVGSSGAAYGMIVETVDGSLWYLESLQLENRLKYAEPREVNKVWGRPRSKLCVTLLSWNVPVDDINAEIDAIYCRSHTRERD